MPCDRHEHTLQDSTALLAGDEHRQLRRRETKGRRGNGDDRGIDSVQTPVSPRGATNVSSRAVAVVENQAPRLRVRCGPGPYTLFGKRPFLGEAFRHTGPECI